MKRTILNILLTLGIILIAILLINSIKEPIRFQQQKAKRELAVIKKLMDIRKAEEVYNAIKGSFAPSWDSLIYVLKHDSVPIVILEQDPNNPDDPTAILRDTNYVPAREKLLEVGLHPDSLDNLPFVPYSNKDTFMIFADIIEYQKTKVPVMEVGIPYKVFMGPYSDKRYQRYDDNYDPDKLLKIGDRNKPTLAGNWE